MSTKAYRYAELRDNIHQLNDDELNELFAYEEALLYDDDEEEWHVPQAFPSLKTLLAPIQSLATLTLRSLYVIESYLSPYAHPYTLRENSGGNFCGHDPKAPRFILHTNPHTTGEKVDDLGDKRRSAILYEIAEKIRDYYDHPENIPNFNSANNDRRKTDRQRNSSRREALVNLTIAMVMSMDLASLRVGYPSKNGFVGRSIKWLAHKADLSYSRTKRAMADLNDSGILASFQYREVIDKEKKLYKFYVASRAFASAFFESLDINMQRFGAARTWSADKLEKQAKAAGTTTQAMALIQLNMNRIHNRLGRSAKKANGLLDEEAHGKAVRRSKRRNEILMELMYIPEFATNEQALQIEVERRFAVENLLDTPIVTTE